METIYMLQVDQDVLSSALLKCLKYKAAYTDKHSREFIISVWYFTNVFIEEEKDKPEIIKEVQSLLISLENQITDSSFDGLGGYDYIQFI